MTKEQKANVEKEAPQRIVVPDPLLVQAVKELGENLERLTEVVNRQGKRLNQLQDACRNKGSNLKLMSELRRWAVRKG